MAPSDIQAVLQWWLTILILGIAFLPLTFALFKNFFDKGYIFSKLIGLGILSYIVFILGIIHLLSLTQLYLFLLLTIISVTLFLLTLKKLDLTKIFRQNYLIFIVEELLFLGALFFWSYIHSFNPDIHGLEKYMDFGFINSILRAEYFPPKDMWFTPLPVNYYYFGHLATAILTKLSGIPSNITFNLMLSTIFALCLTQTFSIGANLYSFMQNRNAVSRLKRAIAGILSALLVTVSGNLHILYAFFKPYENDKPQPLWELVFSPMTFPNSYWYPNATRFIYNTIHEFPIYSWVVADLHGHVLDIPFVLLTIALLLSFFTTSSGTLKTEKPPKSLPNKLKVNSLITTWKSSLSQQSIGLGNLIFIGFLLAIMYMTNAWDGGIYLLLAGLVLLFISNLRLKIFTQSMTIVALSLFLFSFPYNYFFKPFASGIGILCSPEFLTKIGKIGPLLFEKNYCQHSPWWQLLILYGFFYFFVLSFIFFTLRIRKLLRTDVFVFLLIILSTFLIILPEFIYLKDIYPAHYRANTMFKLVFQSFIMLSISCGYIIVRVASSMKFKELSIIKRLLAVLFLISTTGLIALIFTYPRLAVDSYYGLTEKNEEGESKKPVGLDGTKYLKDLYPSDFEAIEWLNKNIKGQPVILEAQGDSYTDYARVSANTGLPTVLGWTVHEWLWRGSYDIPSPRITEITTVYETTDVNTARELLDKYKVKYVFVGALEQQKYAALSEDKFNQIGKVVFQSGNTKIYQLSN
jgi:uncharacterized membrane protein